MKTAKKTLAESWLALNRVAKLFQGDVIPKEKISEALRELELVETGIFQARDVIGRSQQAYAIGREREPDVFGMWHGPHPDISAMLGVAGDTRDDYILDMTLDSETGEPKGERLYRWNPEEGQWEKLSHQEAPVKG